MIGGLPGARPALVTGAGGKTAGAEGAGVAHDVRRRRRGSDGDRRLAQRKQEACCHRSSLPLRLPFLATAVLFSCGRQIPSLAFTAFANSWPGPRPFHAPGNIGLSRVFACGTRVRRISANHKAQQAKTGGEENSPPGAQGEINDWAVYPARGPWPRRGGLGGIGAAGMLPFPEMASAAPAKKFKIALSNSFIGNKWRIEMENVFKAALQMEPFKSEVEGSWFNSGNDVSKQSQQISNLIAQQGRRDRRRRRLADRPQRHPDARRPSAASSSSPSTTSSPRRRC